jgi:hypothetical protein
MGHDANKVLMGSTQTSYKVVDNYAGSIDAGKIVRLKSDGTLSLAKADGAPLGISLGKGLSDNSRTAVVRKGTRVPILLTAAFSPTVGAQVAISDTTGLAKAYTGTGDSYVNAVYATGKLSNGGVAEDGSSVDVALIDFPGGL